MRCANRLCAGAGDGTLPLIAPTHTHPEAEQPYGR